MVSRIIKYSVLSLVIVGSVQASNEDGAKSKTVKLATYSVVNTTPLGARVNKEKIS